jgi:hypothetical protein
MGTITISVKLIEESGQFVSLAFAVSDTGGGFGQRRREDLITPFGRTNTHPNAYVYRFPIGTFLPTNFVIISVVLVLVFLLVID